MTQAKHDDIDLNALAERAGLSGDAARLFVETVAGLRAVVNDPDASATAKSQAGSRLFGLLGLDAPVKNSGRKHRFDDGTVDLAEAARTETPAQLRERAQAIRELVAEMRSMVAAGEELLRQRGATG